jgi:hypothetical protein
MNISAYSPQIIIGACVVVLVVMLLIAWGVSRQRGRRRTAELRQRFGPEYDSAVVRYRSRGRAEAALESRLRRVGRYALRPPSQTEYSRFLSEWDAIQARFVDHPRGAVTEADELMNNLLLTRGYPISRYDQRADDLSVHHPRLVDPYRRAYGITVRSAKNEATTEELRTAMILYRAIFDELAQSKTVEIRRAA